MSETPTFYVCSFCGKDQFQVRRVISHHNANICDGCVLECVTICMTSGTVTVMPRTESVAKAEGRSS